MRGSRRAVIAMVWLLGTGAATAITIEGVRVVGSNVINGESAINPRQANAALSGRTTTSVAPVTTLAPTTTVTTEPPTTVTEAPTTEAPTTVATAPPTTAKSGPTTTKKKTIATTATTAKPPATNPVTTASSPTFTAKPVPPPSTNPPTTPPTASPPPITTTTSSTAPSQCIQSTKFTQGGFVTACFTSTKVVVLVLVAKNGWQSQQTSSGRIAVVQFTNDDRTITVTAFWSGGPAWTVQ